MRTSIAIAASLLLLALSACNQPEPTDITDPAVLGRGVPGGSGDPRLDTDALAVTVGDVEQMLYYVATVEEANRPAQGLKVTELLDPRKRMHSLTLDLMPPYPDSLIVTYSAKAHRDFPDTPVVIRGRVKWDQSDATLHEFASVYSKRTDLDNLGFSFDLMKAVREQLPSVPPTLLVTLDVNAYLMPEGTAAAVLDPLTATVDDPTRVTQALLYPPMRVNFAAEPAAESPAAPAAETTAEPAPAGGDPAEPASEPAAAPAPAPEGSAPAPAPEAPSAETAPAPTPAAVPEAPAGAAQ